MGSRRMRGFGHLVVLLVLVAGAAISCQDTLRRLRTVTYPPDFHYLTEDEIRTTMGQLAVEIVALEEIMNQEGGPGEEDREAVVATLRRMQGLAAKLGDGTSTNHPRLDRGAPILQQDIERALAASKLTSPPNYYHAGRVVGACSTCHAPRHEVAGERPR